MIIKNKLYQKNFKAKGIVYDLSHLQPFDIFIKLRASKTITMRIEFSTHTFTESYDSKIHSYGDIIQDKVATDSVFHHDRAFNEERYRLSLELSGILKSITHNSKAYTAGKGKFLVRKDNYYIFFNIYRHKGKAVLNVKSAYEKKNKLNGRSKRISDFLIDKGF